jgi:hypothetical protein
VCGELEAQAESGIPFFLVEKCFLLQQAKVDALRAEVCGAGRKFQELVPRDIYFL